MTGGRDTFREADGPKQKIAPPMVDPSACAAGLVATGAQRWWTDS
jgi:hypothetical protein